MDYAASIAVDPSGDAYVTGDTSAINFPTVNAFQKVNGGPYYNPLDASVTEVGPTGSAMIYSTFLGGSGDDWG